MKEKTTAIVLAAGQGKRMHSKIQKQFLEIQGHPVLYYSLKCFQESPLIHDIIIVTGEDMISYCKREIVERYQLTKVSAVIAGGKERYDSVYNVSMSLFMMGRDRLLPRRFWKGECLECRKQAPVLSACLLKTQ
mgnify:CR=1 FL=1